MLLDPVSFMPKTILMHRCQNYLLFPVDCQHTMAFGAFGCRQSRSHQSSTKVQYLLKDFGVSGIENAEIAIVLRCLVLRFKTDREKSKWQVDTITKFLE
jgi:hypothetical protein